MSIFKVSTAKQAKNIISIPDICATLQSYDDYSYNYVINLNADPLAAVQTGGMIVRIYVLDEETVNARKFSYFRGRDVQGIISNLRKFDGLIKDESKSTTRNRSAVLEEVGGGSRPPEIDISSFISNEDISLLKRNILPKKSIRRLRTRSVAKLDKTNLNLPVLSLNLNNPSIANGINGYGVTITDPNKIKQQMTELLYEGKIDPASLWLPTNTYASARKTVGGIKPTQTYTSRREVNEDIRKLNIISSQLTTNSNKSMQTDLSGESYIQIVEYEPVTQINLRKFLTIPRETIGKNNFVLRFEVRNTNGKIFQVAETTIQHGANINNFMTIVPPIVSSIGVAKPGNVVFDIRLLDPYAVGVLVYRRTIDPNNVLENAEYTFLNRIEIPIRGGIRTTTYVDTTASSINSYVYRFISFTRDDVKSSLFASVSIKMKRNNILPEEPIDRLPNFAVATYNISNNGIRLSVAKYPDNIVQIKIYKKNLTTKEKKYTYIASQQNINSSNQTFIYNDQNVNLNYIYQYRIDMVYKNGITVTIPNTLQVEYNPIVASTAICNITNIQTTTDGVPNVTFDIEYAIQQNNIELIRQLMKEQNFLAEYQDEITINRDNIESFLVYQVTRINLSTGEIESFDAIPSKNFSDTLYGPPKNVKPINRNNTYRYIITLYARAPDTLFKTLERTINYDVLSGENETSTSAAGLIKPYTFKPYKWLNPLGLRLGTLISQDKHPEIEVLQGKVVDIKEIDITFKQETLPYVEKVVSTNIGGSILIEWNIIGTTNKIDHFIIKNNVLNIKNVIGVAHSVTSTGNYKYKYMLMQEEAGAITFSVVPVYFDYTIGVEVNSNQVVI